MKKTQSTRLARLLIALLVLVALISPSGTALAAGTGQESAPSAVDAPQVVPIPEQSTGDAPSSTGRDPSEQVPAGVNDINATTSTLRFTRPRGLTSGECTTPEKACTLQYASNRPGDNNIFMAEGIYSEAVTVPTGKTIVILGNNSVVDGGDFQRPFYLQADAVVIISSLTIQNGWGVGGGILNYGKLTLTDVTVKNSSSVVNGNWYYGGGVFNGGDLTLIRTTLSGNHASGGGGIYNNGIMTLTNSTISGNVAEVIGGGGVNNDGGTVTLNTSTIGGNKATRGSGGGISSYYGAVTLNGSTVSGNEADFGGGIAMAVGNLTLDGSTVRGNVAATDGGGIHNDEGEVFLKNSSLVRGNSATLSGGAIYSGGGSAKVSLTNSTIGGDTTTDKNQAKDGGGIYSRSGQVFLNPTSFVKGNAATESGGGIFSAGSLTLITSHIDGNTAANGGGILNQGIVTIQSQSGISNNKATRSAGGGIWNDGGTITIEGGTILEDNIAKNYGGGINNDGALDIKGSSKIRRNTAWIGGGVSNSGILTLTNSLVFDNQADEGGGISNSNGSVTLNSSSITTNTATTLNGGGIANVGTSAVVIMNTNSDISGNDAEFDGGGIHNTYGAVILNSSTVTNNTADRNGGGILTKSTSEGAKGTLTLNNGSSVSGNRAIIYGGGIYVDADNLLAVDTGSVVENNKSTSTTQGQGGGIYAAAGATVEISGTISTNSARWGGGLFGSDADITVFAGGKINGNTSVLNGAGISLDGTASDGGTVTILAGAEIEANIAQGNGGGIYAPRYTTVTIAGDLFKNEAKGYGGGVVVGETSVLTLNGSTFSGNTAAENGGGIYNDGGEVTLTASTIGGGSQADENTAQNGGGIFSTGSTAKLTLADSIVSWNKVTVNGGGIYNSGGEVTLTNSTVGENWATTNGGGIWNNATLHTYFVTLYANNAGSGLNLYMDGSAHTTTLYATIVAQKDTQTGVNCVGSVSADSDYNRVTDNSCGLSTDKNNQPNATVSLGTLGFHNGTTQNYLPSADRSNSILDQIPFSACTIGGADQVETDQRGRSRPRYWSTDPTDAVPGSTEPRKYCDVGAIEFGLEIRYVCGAPMQTDPAWQDGYRCEFNTVTSALDEAARDDTIVISGLVVESVMVTKTVTFRGPSTAEATPGTHMGIVQGSFAIGDGTSCPTVAIQDLNISNPGGTGINNRCTLTLEGVTVYDTVTAVQNSKTLTVTNSTLVSSGPQAINNLASGKLDVTHSTIQGKINNGGIGRISGSIFDGCVEASTALPNPFTNTTGTNITSDKNLTRSIALGDVNGDDHLDIIVGNYNEPNRLYLNNGDGTFASGTNITGDKHYTYSIALGDVNGDDHLDIIAGNYTQPNRLYLNNGDGTFARGTNITSDNDSTRSVALGYVNGDDHLDIIAGNYFSNQPNRLYLNNGDGTFAIGTNITSDGQSTHSIALGDVNGDDHLDIIAGNTNQPNRLYLNNGDGTFASGTNITGDNDSTVSIALGDVNGDDHLDIIAGNSSSTQPNRLYLNKGDGTGTFASGTNITGDNQATFSIALGDVNGDDHPDIIAGNYNQPNRLYLNRGDGTGTFASGTNVTNDEDSTLAITVGDVNGGGYPDIIAGNNNQPNRLYLNSFSANAAGYLQGDHNLYGGSCLGLGVGPGAEANLGPLRDNGGPTLTKDLSASSPALDAAACGVEIETDQRGRQRPLTCDIGAVEYGPQTLTVCDGCTRDPDNRRYTDLQEALDRAMAGDTVAVEPGTYTGKFTAYKDGTIRHTGLNISGINPQETVKVRAILQASPDPIITQAETLTATRGSGLSGTVLTVQGYAITARGLEPASGVTVTLQDLTIRHGMALQGGGIVNHGDLTLTRTTVHDNVALNLNQDRTTESGTESGDDGSGQGGAIYTTGPLHLERTTLSGNRAEFQGGAIYRTGDGAELTIGASTLVDNVAGPLPNIWVIGVTDNALVFGDSLKQEIKVGDWILFEGRGAISQRTVGVTVTDGVCNTAKIAVPLSGAGKSTPLICNPAPGPDLGKAVIELALDNNNGIPDELTLANNKFTPEAHTIYSRDVIATSEIGRSIILTDLGSGANCESVKSTGFSTQLYNLTQELSCGLQESEDVSPGTRAGLAGHISEKSQKDLVGPLQDNNQIDFKADTVSGYVYTHALLPWDNPAVDHIPVNVCTVAVEEPIRISATSSPSVTIQFGDIQVWENIDSITLTVALDDGYAAVRLIQVLPGEKVRTQLSESVDYRIYDKAGGQGKVGKITVNPRTLPTDQRGVTLPLRGVRPPATAADVYNCDIGAYEFQPWVVGQAVPRPPSAVGQVPSWALGEANVSDYHLWSLGTAQDLVTRPSLDGGTETGLPDTLTVIWNTSAKLGTIEELRQDGISIWPDDPQLHIADTPVNVNNDFLADTFRVSTAQAYAGTNLSKIPNSPLATSVFSRSMEVKGVDTYSVLSFVNNNGNDPTAQVQVVRTLKWQTPGLVDKDLQKKCVIGTELDYRFTAASGTVVGHADPERKPGYILAGDAFDGVETAGEIIVVQNTVDGLIPPAHIRQDREGPILPVLERAPSGKQDLRIAWYRPDSRNVAWPVKAADYDCNWPTNPARIIIASELGSEIGGQPILDPQIYADPTIYHQPITDTIGYSPNWEHALLASSNLGNPAPALYALRTDLANRISGTTVITDSYALLKYRDAQNGNRVQMKVYQVALTQPPKALTQQPTVQAGNGSVTISGGKVTVPVEVTTTEALHTITATVVYSSTQVTPALCTPNRNDFIQSPYGLQVFSDSPMRSGWPVHFEAHLQAGTDVQYHWNFGDNSQVRIAGATVSNVYPTLGKNDPPKEYTVIVTATNALAQEVVQILVTIDNKAIPTALPESVVRGCQIQDYLFSVDDAINVNLSGSLHEVLRQQFAAMGTPLANTASVGGEGPWTIDSDGDRYTLVERNGRIHAYAGDRASDADDTLIFAMQVRNKHGEIGTVALTDVTFSGNGTSSLNTAVVGQALGPDYENLRYDITAGNPVYAPTPLRSLLDVQICDGTQVYDAANAKPYWEDFKGQVWARSAGEMEVLYFYPLQPGFHLSQSHADVLKDKGLLTWDGEFADSNLVGQCVPWMDQLSAETKQARWEKKVDGVAKEYTAQVLPVAYTASWPVLAPVLTVGETVFERSKNGISGVAEQLAVTRIYDEMAKGTWNDGTGQVEISGVEAVKALAQLIDPVGAVRVELDVTVDGNASLPAVVSSERLLFGGGNAIVGNADDPNLALPFSLRSRILFEDTPQDIDGDGDAHGVLVFKGYYDGASPAYIKGDPLLLLNVMSQSDKKRLLDLCPDGKENCDKYREAIEELYWKSLNPRQVDLCRLANGSLYIGQLESEWAKNQFPVYIPDVSIKCGEDSIGNIYYRDRIPDHAFLIAVQDTDSNGFGNGIPEPYEGLGKGKAVTAGNAAGTGYVTLAYNNDNSLGGLPVSLQVIQVGCTQNQDGEDSTYRGNLLTIESDNLFDEKLTLRHTGDFGGKPDTYDFEWYYAPVDDTGVSPTTQPPAYPWRKWTDAGPGADKMGPEITIEGANVTTLSDNWFVMRYMNYDACGNSVRFSAFAGDPSAKPSELRAQLAQGWIKRVTNGLNPFDARVDDFVSSSVNTSVDMIAQAGTRYEGPVALSNDPDTLNKMGLIEAYQTVLERGRALSIDANINDQGANAALLNVTTRIANLYMLLANDAYMDALDPTVALGMESEFGSRAPSLFAFMNQFNAAQFGLIDEELALLRGRDETLGGVAAGPTYNRLTWNFTNGDGEVAYVQNYNMKDWNQDGFLDEADAFLRYPQGHGDAWGHYLTALTQYYELLRHPQYTWSPRAEPISVAGAPVVVDYYDERRFAINAVAKAQMGAEIVDLTYRKHWADPESQEFVDSHVDASDDTLRAWGVDDWARRSVQGSYFDWAVANAILPVAEGRFDDVRKIDRSTVLEIGQIADRLTDIQTQLDQADKGMNPLGLVGNAVLFDLDPALVADGETHFEQVYQRTLTALDNTVARFNYANSFKIAQRESQNQQRDFVTEIVDEDRAIINDLIELFGYPYDADIGINGTYPAGYDGPDIYNYDLYDRNALTNAEKRCSADDITNGHCERETTTFTVEYKPLDCLGKYVEKLVGDKVGLNEEDLCPYVNVGTPVDESNVISITYEIGVGLDAGRGRFKPASWPDSSARKATGEIPNALQALTEARLEYEMAIVAYENHVEAMDEKQNAIKDRAVVLEKEENLTIAARTSIGLLNTAALITKEVLLLSKKAQKQTDSVGWQLAECMPKMVGLATDATFLARCSVLLAGQAASAGMSVGEIVADSILNVQEYGAWIAETALEADLFDLEQDYELRQLGREMKGMIREEREQRLALFMAYDKVGDAQGGYDQTLQRAFRRLQDLIILRQRWAGQITEQRYNDMAYRIGQTDALQQYRRQFDLAQTYTYLTAAAYDYETNLAVNDPGAADQFLRSIVGQRGLGEMMQQLRPDGTVIPIPGQGGLADPLARMHDNFAVLKGQMGFNNPQDEATIFSLRSENFRLRDDSDAKWRQELARYYMSDIYANDDVARLAKRPFGENGAVPGLVIPFDSTITSRFNFFGNPLGPGDMSFDASQFATKIAAVGVLLDGYDTERLAGAPRVYLLPAGQDVMRPRGSEGVLRYWNISEQLLPLPYSIGQSEMENPNWIPRFDGLSGQLFQTKLYPQLRAYAFDENFTGDPLQTDTRLIGRSVWNTQWLLVIPGPALLADPAMGIERFIEDVDDIHLYFQTYAYAGTARAAVADDQSTELDAQAATVTSVNTGSRTTAQLDPGQVMPLPSAIAYGPVQFGGVPKTDGTVKAVLADGTVYTAPIAPINGTDYGFVLDLPLGPWGTGSGPFGADKEGDKIQFYVDDIPAYLEGGNGLSTSFLSMTVSSIGQPYLLNLNLDGADRFLVGDVNASGRRDSADSLLTLKYDVGLLTGTEIFPPGPNMVYLPLCDMLEDGQCNSGDALRILQCDVSLPGVTCPNNPVRSTSIHASQSTADATLTLDTQVTLDVGTKTVTVRIVAGGTPGELGATSLELNYPADSLVPVLCSANPDDLLDMGTCNLESELGTVRFNAVQAQAADPADSAQTDLALVEITFQLVDGVSKTQKAWAAMLSLTSQGVFDGDGKDLAWRYAETVEPPDASEPPVAKPVFQIYLPSINPATSGETLLPQENSGEAIDDTVDNTVDNTVDSTVDGNPIHTLYMPFVWREE